MKRGRKPKVELEQLINVLRKYSGQFVHNGLVVGPRNVVYQDISAELDSKLSPSAVYTFVKQNNRAKELYKEWGLVTEEEVAISEEITDVAWDLPSSEDDAVCRRKFTITLSKDEWLEIAPKEYRCNRKGRTDTRLYQVLAPNVWTHVINEHFWIQTKLSCCLVFKRANVSTETSVYVNINGYCKDCNGKFCGNIISVPNEGGRVLIDCTYEGQSFCQAPKNKRQIRGAAKEKMLKYMIGDKKTASAIRTQEASRLMDHGDIEPSHVPSLNSLRVAKSKAILSDLTHDDAITSLHISKYTIPFRESIHCIGLNKFFVHYWSPNQINVYRQYYRQSRNSTLAIDATGGLVRKLTHPFGNKSGHLFLYQCVAVGEMASNLQFPVCQMISEQHNNMAVYSWLHEWLQSGGIVPKTVVCDRSLALLSGIVKAFTQFKSLTAYITACYEALFKGCKLSLPNCYVRCDIAHIIKNICSWLPLKSMSKSVRTFLIRSVVEIIRSENVVKLRTLLQALFLLATSTTVGKVVIDGYPTTLDTKAEISRKYLKRLISDDRFEQLEEFLDPFSNENADNDLLHVERDERSTEEETNPFVGWVKSILEDLTMSQCNEEGEYDNALYCPQLVPLIVELVRDLPMVSNIMRPVFEYGTDLASSARVESTFNQIKNRLFADKPLPLRIDSFVCSHINALDGELKLVAASSLPVVDTNCIPQTGSTKPDYCSGMQETQSTLDVVYAKSVTLEECPDCSIGRFPGGAHKCIKCLKSVHIIYDSCSRPISKEEGYDERRICKDCFKESHTHHEDFVLENWRGKGVLPIEHKRNSKTIKNKSVKSYLIRHSEMEHLDLSGKKPAPLGILKNGNRASELKAMFIKNAKDKETRIAVSNTCAFDSVAQIFACAYCDSDNVKYLFNKTAPKGNKFFELCESVACKGISSGVYRKRMEILMTAFAPIQQYHSKLLVLQCEVTIAQLVNKIMPTHPTATDYITCTCSNCTESETSSLSVLSVSVTQPGDVLKLQEELQVMFREVEAPCSNPACYKEEVLQCDGVKKIIKTPGESLFIELVNLRDNDDTDITREVKIALADIPQIIVVAEKPFGLRGVIGFSAARKSISEVGHYVAIAHRLTGQWELYDDCASKCKIVASNKLVEVQVVVYTL